MTQLRFQINSGLAGSAARKTEEEAQSGSETPGRRVQPGSAARDAEKRKRHESAGEYPRSVGFSLRAQGGRVLNRTGATSSIQNSECADKEAAYPMTNTDCTNDALSPIRNSPRTSDLTTTHDSNANSVQRMVARAQSVLHRIFSTIGKGS